MIGPILAILIAFAAPTAPLASSAGFAPDVAPRAEAPGSLDLGDPVLADLLARAKLGSLDVRIALARLESARADVDLARAGSRPQLTIGAEAAVGGQSFSSRAAGAGLPVLGGYEVDLFGRRKSSQRAAVAEEVAALDDAGQARQLVLAEVAKTYVALRDAQAHQAVSEETVRLSERIGDLIRRRQVEGVMLVSDVSAARIQEAQARAEAQSAGRAVGAQCIRLGLLLGLGGPIGAPANVGDAIPPTPPVMTVSSDAVLTRPDIRAAQARLQAADARRAEAVAASRPRFLLTAGLGSGDADLLYLLDVRALAWALAGGLTHELFDGGAAKARIRHSAAEAQFADLTYRKAVGEAWGQTRLQLAQLQEATTTEALAGEVLNRSAAAFGAGQARHADGDIDGLTLARLEVEVLSANKALSDAQAARARAYIDLSLALGGQAP
ncbi:MAG: TolC family protein [bacterium]|nr:TolC family protein [bacterium]